MYADTLATPELARWQSNVGAGGSWSWMLRSIAYSLYADVWEAVGSRAREAEVGVLRNHPAVQRGVTRWVGTVYGSNMVGKRSLR